MQRYIFSGGVYYEARPPPPVQANDISGSNTEFMTHAYCMFAAQWYNANSFVLRVCACVRTFVHIRWSWKCSVISDMKEVRAIMLSFQWT